MYGTGRQSYLLASSAQKKTGRCAHHCFGAALAQDVRLLGKAALQQSNQLCNSVINNVHFVSKWLQSDFLW